MAIRKGLKRKVSHHRRILSRKIVKLSQINPGDIIQFSYSGEDIYDKSPLVLILQKMDQISKSEMYKYLRGNIDDSDGSDLDWEDIYDEN